VSVSNFTDLGLTNTQLRATPIPVSGTVTTANPGLTDTQLRASSVAVSGTVALDATSLAALETISVANFTDLGLTDTQLRATAVPVSGTITVANPGLTDTQLRATALSVTSTNLGLTNTQLRASALPVSGTVSVSNFTDAGLTDTQLRATPVPVSQGAKTVATLLNAVTTNQTSAAQAVGRGRRTLQTSIAGTGSVSATITFYGNNSNANSGGVPLTNAFVISGTTTATDGSDCPGEWPYVYCVVAGITGTSAVVTCSVAV
jgi:hypothetical protein